MCSQYELAIRSWDGESEMEKWMHPLWRHPELITCTAGTESHMAIIWDTKPSSWKNRKAAETGWRRFFVKKIWKSVLTRRVTGKWTMPKWKEDSLSFSLYYLLLSPQEWIFLRLHPQFSQKGKKRKEKATYRRFYKQSWSSRPKNQAC